MKAIEPGMRVKCIKRDAWRIGVGSYWCGKCPVRNGVYVVANAYEDSFDGGPAEAFLVFDEFFGGWAAVNFVPFDSLETLRSILTDVKNPDQVHVRESVDA